MNTGSWPTSSALSFLITTGHRRNGGLKMRGALDRGVAERLGAWGSRLSPAIVNLSLFPKYAEKASQHRIHFVTLGDEMRSEPACYNKLHALVQSISEDIPRPEQFTPVSFE